MDNNTFRDSVFYKTGLEFFDNAIGDGSIKGIKESSIIYFLGEEQNKDQLIKYAIYLGYNLICNVKHKYHGANMRNGSPNMVSCINLAWLADKSMDETLDDYRIGITTIDHDTECPLIYRFVHTIEDLYCKIYARYCGIKEGYHRYTYEDTTVDGEIVKRYEPTIMIVPFRDMINTNNNTTDEILIYFKKICDLCRKYNIILFVIDWIDNLESTPSPTVLKTPLYESDYIIKFKSRDDSIFLNIAKNTVGNTGDVEGIIL